MWKYKYCILFLLINSLLVSCKQEKEVPAFHNWPVLNNYATSNTDKIAIPIGGIGTGTISMTGNGELVDIAIMAVQKRRLSPEDVNLIAPFFAIYTRPDGEDDLKADESHVG